MFAVPPPRVLTVAKREGDEAGVTITLASPNEVMREILAISRYDKLFAILETPWVNRRFEGRLAPLSALLLVAMFAFMWLAVFGTMLFDG